jgi:16S rRNA (adenine(1408)-N(1))-methyltransferase
MTLTRVVGKGRTAQMAAAELAAIRAAHEHCAVDVGTGDAHFAYHLASERPDWLVIGLDAIDTPMGEIAYKAARKPARGGRANLVLLRAAVEKLPPELHAIADEVDVLLPWGALLEGIVRARADVVDGIAALARPTAVVKVTLNGEIWLDSTPARFEDLPVPTPEYVATTIEPEFRRAGIDIGAARYLSAAEAKALPTTWARRLGHGRTHPQFLYLEGVRRDGSWA